MTGTPEGSTKSGFMEKPGIEPATPGLQGIALIHYTTMFIFFFCGFPWVETSTAGRVYDLCVFYYMTGAPEGSPKVVLCGFMVFFMEKHDVYLMIKNKPKRTVDVLSILLKILNYYLQQRAFLLVKYTTLLFIYY